MRTPSGWQIERANLFEGDEQKLETFLPKVDRRLRRLLKRLAPDAVRFRLYVRYRKPRYDVHLLVRSPIGSAFAVAEDEQLVAALKHATDKVARQLREGRERLLAAHRQGRAARRGARRLLTEQARTLWRRPEEREKLMWLLRGALGDLRRHLAAELAVADLEGKVPAGYGLDDLIDEVVARALERCDRIDLDTDAVALDTVLLGLAHERLDELAEQERYEPVRLEELVPDEAMQRDANWVADNDPWWPDHTDLTLEDILPQLPEDWEPDHEATETTRLLEALRQLSPEARRQLLLRGLEGYEPEDIARVTGHPVERVRETLTEASRKVLRSVRGTA